MKFGKRLHQEILSSSVGSQGFAKCRSYVDYKGLKQVLRQEGAISTFSERLASQLMKVHGSMEQEQALLGESVCYLDDLQNGKALVRADCKVVPTLDGLKRYCEWLVWRIESFRNYASLNQMAVRKIIKKFDKRFATRFRENFVVPDQAKLWVSGDDIDAWLLGPARRCMELVANPIGPSDSGSRSSWRRRQLEFWVEELQIGAALARDRIAGTLASGPTPLRLRRRDKEELSWCVRNTFIDCSPPLAPLRQRASSQPVQCHASDQGRTRRPSGIAADSSSRSALMDSSRVKRPVANVGDAAAGPQQQQQQQLTQTQRLLEGGSAYPVEAACETPPMKPPVGMDRRAARDGDGHQAAGETDRQAMEVRFNFGPIPAPVRTLVAADVDCTTNVQSKANRLIFQACSPAVVHGSRSSVPTRPATCSTVQPLLREALLERHKQAEASPPSWNSESRCFPTASDPAPSRWWNEVSGVCPLSGFPIHLLPYPPYKFYASPESPHEVVQLIDGPYLVLKVLCTGEFEACGRPLTTVDIRSIDSYMKRCKLGPFRLGRALELIHDGTPPAQDELDALRYRATQKLENLKQIQRKRLCRCSILRPGSVEGPPAH